MSRFALKATPDIFVSMSKSQTLWACFLLFLVASCVPSNDAEQRKVEKVAVEAPDTLDSEPEDKEAPKDEDQSSNTEPQIKTLTLYDLWPDMCEASRPKECKTVADCPTDAGFEMRCITPYTAVEDYKVCIPKFPKRKQRLATRDRIMEIADDLNASEDAKKLLRLVALRESSFRPWKRHRLDPDRSANIGSYQSHGGYYGHESEYIRKYRQHELIFKADGNPHYKESDRWSQGMGLYGQNAALWVYMWDPQAPPEVLCLEHVATYTYLRRIEAARRKLESGIDCDRDPSNGREFHGTATGGGPSWYDVHRSASGGKICPGTRAELASDMRRYFAARAEKVGLDPNEKVDEGETGRGLGDLDARKAWAMEWLPERLAQR